MADLKMGATTSTAVPCTCASAGARAALAEAGRRGSRPERDLHLMRGRGMKGNMCGLQGARPALAEAGSHGSKPESDLWMAVWGK